MTTSRSLALVLATGLIGVMLALVPALAAENTDSVGITERTTGLWYLRSPDGQTTSFYFGNPGDYPFMGDWDCDGVDTPGLYRQSDGYVYLRNTNTQGPADIKFFFGNPGDVPLAGDFNANGCDTVSIYRPSNQTFYIINALGSKDGGLGSADFSFAFGNPGDKPFTADFNDNGQNTIGLHREATGFVYYRNSLTTGNADNRLFYGDPDDQIIAGRWSQNRMPGPDTVGIFRPSLGTFYLRFSNSQGNADIAFLYGNSNMAAMSGSFGNLPGGDAPPPTQPPTTTTTTQPATTTTTTQPATTTTTTQPATTTTTTPPPSTVSIYLSQNSFGTWSGDAGSSRVSLYKNSYGSVTGEIGSSRVSLYKNSYGSVTGEIGSSRVSLYKNSYGSVTGEIGSSRVSLYKNSYGSVTGEIGSSRVSLSENSYGTVTGSGPPSVAALIPVLYP